MENLDKKKLLELATHSGEHCISIYIPTHRKGHEVNEGYDHILFKNHVQKLRADLQTRGLKSHDVEELLAPMNDLLKNQEFWKDLHEGLVVLRSKQHFEIIKTPISFDETSLINHQFLVHPLLELLNKRKPYHLLHLTKNGATLYKADQFYIKEVNTGNHFPAGLEAITQNYEFEKQYEGRKPARGDFNTASRGDTTEINNEKEYLLEEYFRHINDGIKELLGEDNTPLVLASVEYYQPIYQQVNSYPRLCKKGLTGNFEHSSLAEMHQQANEILADYFVEDCNKRIERYQNSSGTNLTSTDLRSILEAAVTGRVDTIFIRKDAQVWGRFDEQNLQATIHDQRQENDESLLDKAVLITLQNGGEAFVLDSVDLLPNDQHALAAALYRF